MSNLHTAAGEFPNDPSQVFEVTGKTVHRVDHQSVTVPHIVKPGGQHIGRPKALDENAALARRMHRSGEWASTIATALGVSRATVYRVLAASDEN